MPAKAPGQTPLEEGGGVPDLLGGEAAAGRRDRLALGAGAEAGEDLPGSEPLDDLRVALVGDAGEVAGEPSFQRADPLVDRGKDPAGHQELPDVGGGPPGLENVEGLVRQLYLPAGEASQQVPRGPGPAVVRPEPLQAGQRAVHGNQGLGQRHELGPDPAAAVVQHPRDQVGEGAAAAEAAAEQLVLVAAARAGEGLREPGAVGADQGPVLPRLLGGKLA